MVLCAGALSWWRTHEPFFHISGLLLLRLSWRFVKNLLVVDLVKSLTFRHPIHVNNPSDVEKIKGHHCFKFGFALPCFFFCFGELGLFQCMDWRLLSGSYWKDRDSSRVITFSKKFGSFPMFWRMSAQMFIPISIVQEWGVSAPSSNTLFSCRNCYVKSVKQFPCQC